ncbi:MAG: hypothetical protein AAFZ65_07115 [Planctomycetota bacterium]
MRWIPTLIVLLAVALGGAPSATAQDASSGRELAALREEQALLKRQLGRLEETMRVLTARLSSEGPTRTVDLLNQGLELLAQRELEAKTLEEFMGSAEESLQKGQLLQAIEQQSRTIDELEQLLATLLDRRDPEGVEEELEKLRDLRRDLSSAIAAERELEEDTAELEREATSDGQRTLDEGLQQLTAAQLERLRASQELARETGDADLQWITDQLDRALERQRTDADVLERFDANENTALLDVADALRDAREQEQRAARMDQAARALEDAAEALESDAQSGSQVAEELEDAAKGQTLAADTATTEAAEQSLRDASERLSEAAQRARDAGGDPAQRSEAASAAREDAEALRTAAAEARRTAVEDRAEASERLEQGVSRDGLAADPRERLERMLEEAARAAEAAEAAEATGDGSEARARRREAERASQQAAAEAISAAGGLERLRGALDTSQERQAEEAEALRNAIESLDEAALEPEVREAALEALESAAESMGAAAEETRSGETDAAQRSARAGEQGLQQARDAIAAGREERAQRSGDTGQASAQRDLAQQVEQLSKAVDRSDLTPEAQQRVREALEEARAAMEQAAQELEAGRPAAAGAPQENARSALERAAEESAAGRQLDSEQEQQSAQELAERQRALEEEILRLAELNRERDNARPNPSLDDAAESARRAAEALEQGDLETAQQEEERARRELEQAERELEQEEEAYEQLREEELLFRIEQACRTMQETHRAQMEQTREIDTAREPGAAPGRADRLRLRRIADEELALADKAAEMSTELESEQSFVYAEVLSQIEIDLRNVSRDMNKTGGYRSDRRVRGVQSEIDDRLTMLIEALQQEQDNLERQQQEQQDNSDQQQGGGEQAIVPDSAELKLLRRLEVDVQASVQQLRLLDPELEDGGAVNPLIFDDIARLATRHERLTELFGAFRASVGLPDPDAPEPPVDPEGEGGTPTDGEQDQ